MSTQPNLSIPIEVTVAPQLVDVNLTLSRGLEGPAGATGAAGTPGAAATIAVGTVSTVSPSTPASVANTGTANAAVFDFSIPQGATGATGPAGEGFVWEGAWDDTSAYQAQDIVAFSGSSYIATTAIPAGPGNPNPTQTSAWELVAAKGDTGAAGAAGDKYTTTSTTSLVVGNGTKNLTVGLNLAYIPEQSIIIAATAVVDTHMHGTVVSYNPATGAMVADVTQHTGTGIYTSWQIGLSGAAGVQGPAGTAATIAVGFVTTGLPGSSVVVTNTGTSSAAVFDFTIPRGDTGFFVGDASTITTGTLGDARLSANVTLGGNVFSGTGSIVRQTSPALVTPNIGAASASSLTVSAASWNQLNLTVSAYPGTSGSVLKVTPHNGTEPLTVRGFGGYNAFYSTRIDSLRTSYIGLGDDLTSATCTALLLKDSRLSVSFNGTVGPFTAYAGFDASDFRAFNSYTNASNYERGSVGWSSNVFTLATESAGTGTARGFQITVGGVTGLAISTAGNITTGNWQGTAIGIAWGGTGATTAPLARASLGLGNVENTALSTWAGSTNLTTLGTVTTGVWNGTSIAIANGGTGSTTASGARTALGLAIGTDVQAFVSATNTGTGGIVREFDADFFRPTITEPKLRGYSIETQDILFDDNLIVEADLFLVDASSGPITIYFPAVTVPVGKVFEIKRIDSSSNTVTINAASVGGIDGENTVLLPLQNMSLTIVKTSAGYKVI